MLGKEPLKLAESDAVQFSLRKLLFTSGKTDPGDQQLRAPDGAFSDFCTVSSGSRKARMSC